MCEKIKIKLKHKESWSVRTGNIVHLWKNTIVTENVSLEIIGM